MPDELVRVRRHWNDWRTATYRWDDLRGWHWRSESGGHRARSPRPMLYARAWCDALVEGELAHSCLHGEGPHEILVCLVQKDNAKAVVAAAKAAAAERLVRPM